MGMGGKVTLPHQDPIHQSLHRQITDGMLAAMRLDVEQLHARVAQVTEAAGQGDEVLFRQIAELEKRIEELAIRLDKIQLEAVDHGD